MSNGLSVGVGARTFGEFIAMLEDGRLNADLAAALTEIAQACNDHVLATHHPATAALSLKFGFQLKDGVFEISAKFDTTLPKLKRGRSVAWTTPDGRFSPQNPRQANLPFGIRDVSGHEVRTIRDEDGVA